MNTKITFLSKAYLPLFILLAGFTTKTLLYSNTPLAYNYDEVITTTISRQPLPQLFDTIQSEPHPPGVYLFLKLLPTTSPGLSRLIVITTSHFLTLLALVYGIKTKVIDKFNLAPGLALFFASHTFQTTSAFLKQDSLSTPIFLFLVVACFNLYQQKTKPGKTLPLSFILIASLLFIGYIPFVLGLIITTTTLLISKTTHRYKFLTAISLLIFAYLSLFGTNQLTNNTNRLAWIQDAPNSLFAITSQHLVGETNHSILTDIISFLFVVPITLLALPYIKLLRFKYRYLLKKRNGVVVIVAIMLLSVSEELKVFAQPRFLAGIMILLSLAAGRGLLNLTKKTWHLYFLTFSLFLLAIPSQLFNHVNYNSAVQKTSQIINSHQSSQKTGLISDHPLPNVFLLEHSTNPNVVPVNLLNPNAFKDSTTILKEHLLLDQPMPSLSVPETRTLLSRHNLTEFFYSQNTHTTVFNPNRNLLISLTQSCQNTQLLTGDSESLLFHFSGCSFPN